MIEKMQKIFVYGLSDDAAPLMRDIMRAGCLQITDPRQLSDSPDFDGLKERRSGDLYDWEQKQGRLSSALSALQPYIKGGGLFAQKPAMDFNRLRDEVLLNRALELCDEVAELQKQQAEINAQLGRCTFAVESLKPWSDYKLPLEENYTRLCRIQLLTLPVSVDITELEKQLGEAKLAVGLSQISEDKDQRYLAMVAHRDDYTQAEELLRQNGASRVSFSDMSGIPVAEMTVQNRRIKELTEQAAACESSLAALGGKAEIIKQAYDGVQSIIDCEKGEQKLLHTEKTTVLGAWMPASSREKIEKLLSGYPCFYQITEPQKDEETPVLLKNNKWIAPFESVTQMYSLPSSKSIDPDPFMAPFFFVFFGMMLSDAGYGLLLAIGGLIGAKLMGGNKLMKMLGYCGISTIFWGLLYGSFFGDVFEQVLSTFFNIQFTMPKLIDPLTDPITVLIISFALGALHIFVGMGLKAYLMIKRGHPWAALFDVGSWYFVLIGLVMLLAGGVFAQVGTVMAIGGAVMLVLTQGRDKKNIFMKIASGVLSLYDITGYFSDVLSYSRIMALGLATGVIASVINTMGTMPGASFIGVIAFILIFIFGHLLNLAINALGSYVHTSRLQYVEFFGKFFEGGGQGFNPLRANTKYVNINDREDN